MSSFSIFRPIPHSSKRQRRDLIPNMFESIFDKYPFFRAVPCVLCTHKQERRKEVLAFVKLLQGIYKSRPEFPV